MIPKLYDEDYVIAGAEGAKPRADIEKNGYGFLNTCKKCIVEEKTSGVYTLEMELSTSDRYAANVLPNTFVKVIPNKKHNPQLFQIYRVREEGNKLSVSGYHIKYLATNNMISGYNRYFNSDSTDGRMLIVPPNKQGTAKDILQWLQDERYLLIEDYTDYAEDDSAEDEALDKVPYDNQQHFTISSDIDDVVRTVRLREFTGEKIGSFLTDKENGMGQFDGEWLYDNFDLILKKTRGKAEAVKLRYGYELKNVVIEYSSDNNYNFVYPFAKVKPNSGVEFFLGIEPLILEGDGSHKFPRLKTVDVSEHVPELEVITDVDSPSSGPSMINAVGEIEQAFAAPYYQNRYHTRGYEIAVTAELNYSSRTVQDLELYDPVVLVTENGREISSKVNGITFDALEEKIVKVELDNKPLTLHDLLEGKRR